VFGGNGEIMTF